MSFGYRQKFLHVFTKKQVDVLSYVATIDISLKRKKAMTQSNHHFVSDRSRRLKVSRHAAKRAQQRGINQAALGLLLAYGCREFDGQGGIRYLMTDSAMKSVYRLFGHTKQLEALAGVYAVISAEDETVITTGHRYN